MTNIYDYFESLPNITVLCNAAVKRIDFEAKRQIEATEAGEKIIQETRRWDDAKGENYAMRSKEEAQDYRYFPDPDLVPIVVTEEQIEEIKNSNRRDFRF